MVRSLASVAFMLVLSAGVFAQQPNSVDATLVINGAASTIYPIQNVTVFSGVPATMAFSGLSGAPISLGQSPNLAVGASVTPIGIFDLDFATTEVLINGGTVVDLSGTTTLTIPVPTGLPAGLVMAFQSAILSITAPSGAVLSAATEITTAVGIVGANLLLGDDSSLNVSLTSNNVTASFYGSTYNSVWVNSNGSVSFGVGDGGDFTATSGEFRSAMPRAAPFWTDLSPNAGGTVRWQIDFTQPLPTLSVTWTNVPSGYGAGGLYSFTFEQQLTPTGVTPPAGDIRLINPATNLASPYDMVVGISPGGNLGSQTTPLDLNMLQVGGGHPGGPLDAIWEFYSGTTSTTGLVGPAFDLVNVTLTFAAVGVGAPGASYFMF